MSDDSSALPVVALFRMAFNALSAHIFQAVIDAGFSDLRPSHGNVMDSLSFEDGLRQRDLAERAGMSAQSIGELVDDLERLDYVERRPDPTDRRAKRVYLTKRGRASRDVAGAAVRAGEARLRILLGEENYRRLHQELEAIIQAESGEM